MKQFSSINFKRMLCLCFITMLMAAFLSNVTISAEQKAVISSTNPVLVYNMGNTYVYHWNADLTARYHGKRIIDPQTGEIEYVMEENKSRFEGLARVSTFSIPFPGEYMMAMKIVQPRFFRLDEQHQEIEEVEPYMTTELERPIFFKQNSEGLVTEFYVAPGEEPAATNIKKGIISALQTHLYGDTTGIISGTPETDASGSYIPRYSSQGSGQMQTITKTRDVSCYTAFANGESVTDLAQAVTIDENILSNFNIETGNVQDVTVSSHIITTGVQDEILPEDGAGMWSESICTDTLVFNGIEPNTEQFSMEGYECGNLIAVNTVDTEDPILPTSILAQIGENPNDTNLYNKLVKALLNNPGRVNQIREAFKNSTVTPLMHHAVIGALGALGTPEAQEILIHEIILQPGMNNISKGQGIVALGLLKNPTEETICTLETLSRQEESEVTSQAILMLGAAVEKLVRTNPDRAAQIVKNLEFSLIASGVEKDVDLYLGALGNAGFNSSLNVIANYLNDQSPIIRHTAVTALRKLTAPGVLTYLLQVMSTETESAIKEVAQDIYKEKTLNEDIASIMTHYEWTWEKKIGNGDAYGKLFAKITCDDGSNFIVYGEGEAKAYAWYWNWSLAKATALSDVVSGSRRFIAKAYVLGNQVYSTGNVYLACNQTQQGTIWNQTLTFFNLSYSFYPYGIKVTVGVSASGNVQLKYKFELKVCNSPVIADASVSGIAQGSVNVTGEASVSIYLAKAGVTLTADIFKTTVTALAQAILRSTAPIFQRHFKLYIEMQAISGRLYFWAKLWWPWSWHTVLSVNIWSFSSSAYTSTPIDQWW